MTDFVKHFWPHLTALVGTGCAGIFFRGALGEMGSAFVDFFGKHFGHKTERKLMRDKAARADERGKLYDLIARNHIEVSWRLDCCERRHAERDRTDKHRQKELDDCREKNSNLALVNAKLINEARMSALDNAKLLAENAVIEGRLKKKEAS